MKRLLSLLVLSLICVVGLAQTVTLTFTGRDKNNQYVQLSRVVIENATQNWQETITYPDTILTMGKVGIEDYEGAHDFALLQNNPNPFRGTTYATLQTSTSEEVILGLSDVNGRLVETLRATSLLPGTHQFRIQVANTGTYLLTASQNGKISSIKMVNNGKGAVNKIEYQGSVETRDILSQLKNTKGETDNPFTPGDEMIYIGYAMVNGTEYQSQTVRQNQNESEDFILQFDIEPAITLPVVSTDTVSNITETTATCGGEVISDGGDIVTTRGVCWSTTQNPTVDDAKTTNGSGRGTFTSTLKDLSAGTVYYVRAYATNSEGTAYGNEVTFTTANDILPTVTTATVTDITQTTATCGGDVTDDGGAPIIGRGICYSTKSNPTIAGPNLSAAGTTGSFTCNLKGLTAGTIYYVRAYATTRVGTAYGNEEVFTTEKRVFGKPCPGAATVTDHEGNVYNTVQIGNQCWTKENMRCKTSPSTGTSILDTSSMEISFSGKKAYYVNNDADNTEVYGLLYNWNAAVDTFNTALGETSTNNSSSSAVAVNFGSFIRQGICPKGWHIPTDAEWTNLMNYVKSQQEYLCGGENTNIAKALASITGWKSYESNCAIGNDQSSNNATGFSAYPAGQYNGNFSFYNESAKFWSTTLYRGTGAYTRSLAANDALEHSGGVSMAFSVSVRCIQDMAAATTPPTVHTLSVSNITAKTATAGGDVINDGGATVTARGVCWSYEENPKISNDHTTDGSGTGSFTSNITGLSANTTYYVRAYATNSEGTSYGEQVKFTTSEEIIIGQPCPSTGTVTDHEGNVYNTVQIGNQCWTKESMRCTTSPSTNNSILGNMDNDVSYTGKQAYYVNGSEETAAIYGLLYNWCAAVDTFNATYGETSVNTDVNNAPDLSFSGKRRGICPQGWHVPSNAEWTQLTDYVSSQSQYVCDSNSINIAKALASTKEWGISENDCAVGNVLENNDATGFSAVPAGGYGGSYEFFGLVVGFWSATQYFSNDAYARYINSFGADVGVNWGVKNYCYSVRCIRD